jgi:hypothetical protein
LNAYVLVGVFFIKPYDLKASNSILDLFRMAGLGVDRVLVHKIYRGFGLLFFFLTFTTCIVQTSVGVDKFFPLDKVKPGMKGYGCTVFSGTKIQKFGVQVIGTVDKSMGKDKLILVKLSGKLLEENGGLSAGMSGSPVYIHNQLAGAISYGFENADSSLALVTPIEMMLEMREPNLQAFYLPSYHQWAIPVRTPIIISGMKKRGFDLLSHLLESYGFRTVAGIDAGESSLEMGKNLIKPGSAISVMMVAGDYQVSALGTVTWVEGRDFLAFGHSYNNRGKVDYFAYQANVLKTIQSSQMAFKLGTPLKLIGRITEDRQAGIYGKLEEIPTYIQVHLNIRDTERNRVKESTFYVQSNEQTARDLIVAGVTDSIDQTIDRVGPGTATVSIEMTPVSGNEKLFQQNLYYSKDIATACVKDLNDLLTLVVGNDFSTLSLKNISVNVELTNEQKTARVVKITSDVTKVKPGDVLRLNVLLHRYRGDDFVIPLDVKVPLAAKPGKLNLIIYGGSKESDDTQEDDKKEAFKLDYKNVSSFGDLLTNFLARPKNNELAVDYDPKPDEAANNRPLLKSATQYYLFGEAQLAVEVQQ